MRIICLLSWFDERPSWLAALTAGVAEFCDHIVAIDGAYELFPGACAHSRPEQAEAIREVAYATGLGCTIHAPDRPWQGDQVEKRNVMFQLGRLVGGANDWFYITDADHLITRVPDDLRDRLAASEWDVAEVMLDRTPLRAFVRNLPGLRCKGAHYVYAAERDCQTVYLRGHGAEPAENLRDFWLDHRHDQRSPERQEACREYKRLRVELALEHDQTQPALAGVA